MKYYSGKTPKAQEAVQLLSTTKEWNGRLLLGIITIALAPAAEELLFRGILYPFIKRRWPRMALWGTALLFGAFHMYLPGFVPLALLALILTWLYEKTDNLLAPIAAHSLFNTVNFALLYLTPHLNGLPPNE
jgi:membrane protease YdiL (CAAX protease family)